MTVDALRKVAAMARVERHPPLSPTAGTELAWGEHRMTTIRDIRAAFMDSVETAARAAILARAMDEDEIDPDEFIDGILATAAAAVPPPAGVTRGDVIRLVARIGIAITERQLEEARRAEAEALAERGCERRRRGRRR